MKIIRAEDVTDSSLVQSNVPDSTAGLTEWAAGTTYAAGDLAMRIDPGGFGRGYLVYRSLQNGNVGHNPDTSPDWWLRLSRVYQPWSASTTYSAGDIVMSPADHRLYESVQNANTNKALNLPDWWLDLGPTNRWRMFDRSNTSQTIQGESISVAVQVDGRADSVALLNIIGATVHIEVETVEDGVIYDETFNLVSDSGITNWYEYFFEDVVRRGDFLVTDIPINANPEIRVTLNEPSGDAAIGTLAIGQSRDLGLTIHPARVGIQDFSRKVQDDFGNFTIVQRNYARRAEFRVAVLDGKVDALTATLASYRATPVVWVGVDQIASTWIYGFFRDFQFDLTNPNETYLALEIEGLT